MDLSAVIFVVLALAWAVYLIPKALQHHDEMASGRLVEGHSERVRILRRKQVRVEETVPEPEVEAEPELAPVATKRRSRRTPTARPADTRPATRSITRAAARRAAQRRRRVLGVLVLALAVVGGLAAFAIVPVWAPAVPGAMVLLFLVVARLSVRSAQRASLAQRRPVRVAAEPMVEEARPVRHERHAADLVDVLADEDVVDAPREEIEAVLADDGSLWDPLPMTLPTYVNKARARRTVRTIELTHVASSGHSEADSALAREAEAAQAAQAATAAEAAQRKAAGA